MNNHYYSPHMRRIWGTAFTFLLPLPIASFFYDFSSKSLVLLMFVFLCSIDVYKAIVSSRTQSYIFLSCLVISSLLVFFHFHFESHIPILLIPLLGLCWGAVSYDAISKSWKTEKVQMEVSNSAVAANKTLNTQSLKAVAGTVRRDHFVIINPRHLTLGYNFVRA